MFVIGGNFLIQHHKKGGFHLSLCVYSGTKNEEDLTGQRNAHLREIGFKKNC
jgi:hypothetical protein